MHALSGKLIIRENNIIEGIIGLQGQTLVVSDGNGGVVDRSPGLMHRINH